MKQTPHVALLPSPGMGHIIPMLEFAKKLAVLSQTRLSITVIIPDSGLHPDEQKPFLESLPRETINLIFLPMPDLDDFQADQISIIVFTITRSLPSIRNVIGSLAASTNLVALVYDFLGQAAFDVAEEFNLRPYLFLPSNALMLSLYLYLPELDSKVSGAFKDLPDGVVQFPGCTPLKAEDLFETCLDRDSFEYKWLVNEAKRFRMAEGIIVNTFEDMEIGAIKALKQMEDYPKIFPIGPLVRETDSAALSTTGVRGEHDLTMKWLEGQPHGSVLFVSFGSLGSLSPAQIHELAFGLEISEKRFLWVVRTPKGGGDLSSLLPEGFLERNKGRGLVVSNWAPQARILGHGSTGGFLTHCGWNSIQESVANGVPMIAWPLQSDQKMNATLLSEELKIATRIRADPSNGGEGPMRRTVIANSVKNLMEGEEGKEFRKRTRALMEATKMAHSDNGPSTKSLAELVWLWEDGEKTK